MQQLKLIWDFRGPHALQTAKHHEIHLKEYIQLENLNINLTGFTAISEMHAIAFMIVSENEMKIVRDALKPHRGQLYLAES